MAMLREGNKAEVRCVGDNIILAHDPDNEPRSFAWLLENVFSSQKGGGFVCEERDEVHSHFDDEERLILLEEGTAVIRERQFRVRDGELIVQQL